VLDFSRSAASNRIVVTASSLPPELGSCGSDVLLVFLGKDADYALGSNAVICPRYRRVVGSRGSSSVCMPSRRLEQPTVAVAVAKDLACVDMVDGRLIENLHVDDARRVLAWAAAIAEGATHRLTLRRQAHGD